MGAHHHHHCKSHSASTNIGIALVLNAGFTVIEIVGGLYTGSMAILSDALHDLGDTLSLALAFTLEKYSNRAASARFSYGFRRLSLLSAAITAAVLLVGSIFIFWEAIERLRQPVMPKTEGMILLALLGITVNGVAALKVMRGGSLNEQTISWHLIEDVLGWVAVLIASIVMHFWHVPEIDAVLSMVVTAFVLIGVSRTTFKTFKLFMQGVPPQLDLKKIASSVLRIVGVRGVHDIHAWSLDGTHHVVTMHAVVASTTDMSSTAMIKSQIRALFHAQGQVHVTVEIEYEDEECPDLECVKL